MIRLSHDVHQRHITPMLKKHIVPRKAVWALIHAQKKESARIHPHLAARNSAHVCLARHSEDCQ